VNNHSNWKVYEAAHTSPDVLRSLASVPLWRLY
jgi:hypothetical protein